MAPVIELRLQIPYKTEWGQQIVVAGSAPALGDRDYKRGAPLSCCEEAGQLVWRAALHVAAKPSYQYKYFLVTEGGQLLASESEERSLQLPEGLQDGQVVEVADTWQDSSSPAYVLSRAAFRLVCPQPAPPASRATALLTPCPGEVIVRLSVRAVALGEGEEVVVTGNAPQLGSWQQSQPLALAPLAPPLWQAEIRVPAAAFPITYKYGIRSSSKGSLKLEHGENHMAALPQADAAGAVLPALMARNDGDFRQDRYWRGAAIATPVFSLRTRSSVGAGEFRDLRTLVDFCSAAGLRMIQLLPVNDTSQTGTWWDSYPYSSLSVFALHPLYLSLDALSDNLPADIKADVEAARRELDLPDVDYERTMAAKLAIARRVFNLEGQAVLQSEGFRKFFAAQQEWLRPYAAFCFLKDLFGTAEHWQWGSLSRPTPQVLERVTSPSQPYHAAIQFAWYLQYQLHCQLLDASQYAAQHRVALKGDLPIGVGKASVDTWMYPELFRMDKSTGAPPDYFDRRGQNWGFPTYNWQEMAKDNYAWWRRRLAVMAQYFHAYRIDHILGFFRIWEIPGDCCTGLLGHFRPCHPVTRQELEAEGIWDFDRLCEPYITPALVRAEFGDLAEEITSRYLQDAGWGRLRLRPQYASEEQIDGITARPDSPEWLVREAARTREGLLALRQNLLLMRDPERPNAFFPRYALMDTSSFAELEHEHWRDVLRRLHDDYFFKRQDELWRGHALATLPVLQAATDMLVCGEDLGLVPGCLPPVMDALGLVGLRIQRFGGSAGAEFGEPGGYPYMTVASPSCHDTTPTRAWWEEDAERRQRFWEAMLGGQGHAPAACTPDVMTAIAAAHLEAPSMWAIFPVQDIMALSARWAQRPAAEETINNPTVRHHYWRYRMHARVEELTEDTDLLAHLQALLLSSGRCSEDDVPNLLLENGYAH